MIRRADNTARCLQRVPHGAFRVLVASGIVAASGFVWAAKPSAAPLSAQGIMARHDCLQCHRTETATSAALITLGPSFRQVAQRYRKDKTAEDRLIKKIQRGGSGQWGTNNMPPQAIGEDDTRAVVRWILKLK